MFSVETHHGSLRPKKGRQSRSIEKLMMMHFIHSKGPIYINWVPSGQKGNKECHMEVLHEFRRQFRRKLPENFKSRNGWHFHQDNNPCHKSHFVTDYLAEMQVKTVPHHPYSPDLIPCDF